MGSAIASDSGARIVAGRRPRQSDDQSPATSQGIVAHRSEYDDPRYLEGRLAACYMDRSPNHVLERAGHEEILLCQPQLLPCFRFVIRMARRGSVGTDLHGRQEVHGRALIGMHGTRYHMSVIKRFI